MGEHEVLVFAEEGEAVGEEVVEPEEPLMAGDGPAEGEEGAWVVGEEALDVVKCGLGDGVCGEGWGRGREWAAVAEPIGMGGAVEVVVVPLTAGGGAVGVEEDLKFGSEAAVVVLHEEAGAGGSPGSEFVAGKEEGMVGEEVNWELAGELGDVLSLPIIVRGKEKNFGGVGRL